MRLGVRAPYSRRIEATVPSTDVEVYLSPSVARWDYLPEAPYMIVRREIGPIDFAAFYGWEQNLADDVAAILSFSRLHMPRAGQWAYIADVDNQIVLGWRHDHDALEWQGCEFMFAILATSPYTNQVDVGIWETQARDRAAVHEQMEALRHDRSADTTS